MRVPLPNGATLWLMPVIGVSSLPQPSTPGWIQVQKVTGLTPNGGAERYSTHRPLGSYEDVRTPDGRDPIDIEVQYQDAPASAHHKAIVAAKNARQELAWMIRLRTGGSIVFAGYPGGSLLPALDRSQLMVVSITVAVTVQPHRIPG